ncbi:hypothetical protein CDD83_5060 [Cordyceps sp. RAO-2017]|nr:hypothetical protein CDD83_5060 [Cordyceps sp. RAO-2017]
MRRSLVALLGLRSGLSLAAAPSSGNHPEWPRWCGKAYQPQYPSFDPGGQTVEPPALPGGPALDVQFKPRYSIYLESEAEAEFVVDAAISRWRGQPWPDLGSPDKAPAVRFTIALTTGDVLVSDTVPAGSRSNLFAFRLAGLRPRLEPYEVVLMGDGGGGERNLTARSELFVLPEKKTGSVSRLDNVNGGILFRGRATGGAFEPFLPHGFYASCDNFLCDADRLRKIRAYAGLGLNSLVSLTTVAASGDTYRELDRLDLRFMYDLRDFYKNVTAVREQVAAVRDFDALYAYWGADEPDGHQDPFPLVVEAREAIRSVDPYHPVSVTLNCQDYYFGQYSAGADIVMEDAYPVGINSSFSKWGTACNATYGDCGCDNCAGDVGDVARRLDRLARHERRLGLRP